MKLTELLLEVDQWTGFTRHFTHLKSGDTAKDRIPLLTTILADAINLGLSKMAESCPGSSYAKLSWLQAWHIRDDTYSSALAQLVNAQFRQPFSDNWGDGTTSSSDGQRFKTGGKAESTGHINPKYGAEPGKLFYTHISDQYAPFSSQVVNVGVRDSTYVLDGLLHHESDLRIEEHYTDTAGFTDHVFALMHLLGFRFAPRIRDLSDTKLYLPPGRVKCQALKAMTGGTINLKAIRTHWNEILRLATSIKQGSVTASLMLRKLGSYPRQNGLAVALRELGRIERTLFILSWLQSVDRRRRVHAGLNKGEARNALARAVFLCRLGEIRDRSFEQQRYRASGVTLVTAAIALWNTVYIERAVQAFSGNDQTTDPRYSNTSPHSGGNTSISPATTTGRASGPQKAGSDPSATQVGLSVLCCPFSHAAPSAAGKRSDTARFCRKTHLSPREDPRNAFVQIPMPDWRGARCCRVVVEIVLPLVRRFERIFAMRGPPSLVPRAENVEHSAFFGASRSFRDAAEKGTSGRDVVLYPSRGIDNVRCE